MGREILFRGKRVDGGEWVFGSLLVYPGGYAQIASPTMFDDVLDKYTVDPATVGQYTGLTDKNGVKIFEGDIVKYIYEPGEIFWNANQTSVITWDKIGFRLDGIMGTNKYALLQGWLVSVPCKEDFFEVIGNIHENPELLGVKT